MPGIRRTDYPPGASGDAAYRRDLNARGGAGSRSGGASSATAPPIEHEQGIAAEAGQSQGDPDRPTREDFPNAGGLTGASAAEKQFRDAASKYDVDEVFRAEWKAKKAKERAEAKMLNPRGRVAGVRR